MSWNRFTKFGTSIVFSPKVTPDPADAKRLDEKFQQALRLVDQDESQKRLRIVSAPRNSPDNKV